MAARKVQRLGLEDDIVSRLIRHKVFTCQDLLCKNRLELLRIFNTCEPRIQEAVVKASKACAPTSTTALSMYQRGTSSTPAFFPTSLKILDRLLQGGLISGTITEIAGPPGCGKTQFCLMLSVLATLPQTLGGLNGAVMYIDTESAFSAERLVEIAQCRFPDQFCSDDRLMDLINRVHVSLESTCSDLLNRLEDLEEDLIDKGICLIILDSVASLVRKEFDGRVGGNLVERTNVLAKQAAILKYLAEDFSIPVIVTNQITTHIGPTGEGPPSQDLGDDDQDVVSGLEITTADSEGGHVTAALGNTWSHSVNTRLILQYRNEVQREVLIAKSPLAPFAKVTYTVQDSGLVCGGKFKFLEQNTFLQPLFLLS
ncbi:DNA repair protein RAD51 homolog 2-like [Diadema antillarum]|uniref:DNA repair protein RAD51 homolog 2-like n=1 Tax=Diadema antillarum TaxID=105358 RepID=UPI003A88816C